MRTILVLVTLLIATFAFAERQPYERYATIVDRQMFGELPPGFDPTKMPNEVSKSSSREEKELTQEQEQVKKSIHFSVINVTTAGETVVGFSDNGDPKNPLHYYLKVGESQNGWTVKEADPQEATMTVEKDGVEVTLKLGGASGDGKAAAKAAEPRAGSGLLGNRMSFRERRRLEQQEQQANAAKLAEEAKAREAREAEEKQQREAERAEQREQLLRIQEELRKAREARESQKDASSSEVSDG